MKQNMKLPHNLLYADFAALFWHLVITEPWSPELLTIVCMLKDDCEWELLPTMMPIVACRQMANKCFGLVYCLRVRSEQSRA